MNMFTSNRQSKQQFFLVLAVIIATAAIVAWLFGNKNVAALPVRTIEIPTVDVISAQAQNLTVTLPARGMVQPARQMTLLSTVIGTVIHTSKNLVAGGNFSKDEILLEVDPAYLHAELQKAKAAYQQALFHEMEVKANIEAGQSMLDDNADTANLSDLAKGKPQLALATSAREAALAAMQLAEKQLANATLRAPFNGRVMSAGIQEQEQLAPGRPLAQIYATDSYQLRIPLTQEQLALVDIPGKQHNRASEMVIRNPLTQQQWRGKLLRSEGFIAPNRQIYVIAEILPDKTPLDELVPGTLLEASIQSRILENIVVLPASAVENNEVWILAPDQRLHRNPVGIIHRDSLQAYIASGLDGSEQVLPVPFADISENMQAKAGTKTIHNTTGQDQR
jgi:RND family efflux transporter MFP subunit